MTFLAILRMQWHWLRTPLLVVALAMVIAPSLGLSGLFGDAVRVSGTTLIERGESVGLLIAVLAGLAGAVTAQVLWSVDDRGGHAYALSLPIDRASFLRQRALAALILLLIPTLAIALGVTIAATRMELAPGIQAYPGWVAMRAYAAMVLAFSLVFFVRYGVSRRVRRALLVVVVVAFAMTWLELQFSPPDRRGISHVMSRVLIGPYSPFRVVLGNWRIVDA